MKLFTNIPIIIAAATCLFFTDCKKTINPVDQLPPATHTGANTFGCLINGRPFTPGGSALSGPNLAAIYQYMIPGTPSGYTFAIDGTDKRDPCNITDIGFGFDSVSMKIGNYFLKTRKNGQGAGGYHFFKCNTNGEIYDTNDRIGGQLTLARFDLTNQIASGTFWFNVLNDNGDTIKITNGRFDVHFTR